MTTGELIELDNGAAFRIAPLANGRACIQYRPNETHPGWPAFEDVCDMPTIDDALKWTERPPAWWTDPDSDDRGTCRHCRCSIYFDGWDTWRHAWGDTHCTNDNDTTAEPEHR